MLIINDSLNKRFCKKVFGFSISLFKKCYVHNIFIINFHNIVNWNYSNIFYTFNIFIGSLPHTQPNPFPFSFYFLFFFLPFFLSHKSQPCTFCNAPAQFKSKEKKEKKEKKKVKYFKEPHVWPHLPHSPQPHISQESSLSWPATHLLLSFFFFFFIQQTLLSITLSSPSTVPTPLHHLHHHFLARITEKLHRKNVRLTHL